MEKHSVERRAEEIPREGREGPYRYLTFQARSLGWKTAWAQSSGSNEDTRNRSTDILARERPLGLAAAKCRTRRGMEFPT